MLYDGAKRAVYYVRKAEELLSHAEQRLSRNQLIDLYNTLGHVLQSRHPWSKEDKK